MAGLVVSYTQEFDTAIYNYFSFSDDEAFSWDTICSVPIPQGLAGRSEGWFGPEYCKDEKFHSAMRDLHDIAQTKKCRDSSDGSGCSRLNDDELRNMISFAIERNSLTIDLNSPGELRVYDRNGYVTGIVDGEIKEKIPNSFYDEEDHAVIIYDPIGIDLYRYEVVGIEKPYEKTYGLSISSVVDNKKTVFSASAIPTNPGEVHQFSVDWQTLAQGGDGVTMKIDKEGDGVFEKTIVSDATFESLKANAGEFYENTEGAEMTFDASLSTDLDGSIVLYEWDFDEDGDYEKNSTSPIITNIYEDDYNGTVGLRVTDDEGLTATDTAEIVVSNVAPIVEAGADITAQYSDPVQFGGSFTDPGSLDTHTTKWEFGDGKTDAENLTPTHYYARPGEYNVVLTVTDDDGGIGQNSLKVNVAKEAVIITVENQEGSFGDAAILKATILDDDVQVLSHGPYKANFMVGDRLVGEASIDENGKAEISWVVDYIPTDLIEVKMIAVSFGENEYYLAGGGQGSLTVKSAKQLKQDSLDKLRSITNDDKQVQKEIDKAIGDIESSLGAGLWADASHLDQKQGHKVFDSDKQAIKSLLKIIEEKGNHEDPEIAAGLQSVVDGFVKADALLTKVAISDAEKVKSDKPKTQEKIDSEISKAKADLEKAAQELATSDPDKAIDDLKKSWDSAQLAMSFSVDGKI